MHNLNFVKDTVGSVSPFLSLFHLATPVLFLRASTAVLSSGQEKEKRRPVLIFLQMLLDTTARANLLSESQTRN